MRDVQAKRAYVTNDFVQWPNGPSGCLAPLFPPDGFYGAELSAAQQASLITALNSVGISWRTPYMLDAIRGSCYWSYDALHISGIDFGTYGSGSSDAAKFWHMKECVDGIKAFRLWAGAYEVTVCPYWDSSLCEDIGDYPSFATTLSAPEGQFSYESEGASGCGGIRGKIQFELTGHPDLSGLVYGTYSASCGARPCRVFAPFLAMEGSCSTYCSSWDIGEMFGLQGGSLYRGETEYGGSTCCGVEDWGYLGVSAVLQPDFQSRSRSSAGCRSCSSDHSILSVHTECLDDAVVIECGKGQVERGGARVVIGARPYAYPGSTDLLPLSSEFHYTGSGFGTSGNMLQLPYDRGFVRSIVSGSQASIEYFDASQVSGWSPNSGAIPRKKIAVTRQLGSLSNPLHSGASESGMQLLITEYERNSAGTALDELRTQSATSFGDHCERDFGVQPAGGGASVLKREWVETTFDNSAKLETFYSSGDTRTALKSKRVVRSQSLGGVYVPTEVTTYSVSTADPEEPADIEKIAISRLTYFSDSVNDGAAFGKLKQEIRPDGGWTRFAYDEDTGQVTRHVANFLNHPSDEGVTDGADAANVVTTFETLPALSLSYSGSSWWGAANGTLSVAAAHRTITSYPKWNGSAWVSVPTKCTIDVELTTSTSPKKSVFWMIECAELTNAISTSTTTIEGFLSGVIGANSGIPYKGSHLVTVTEKQEVSTGVWRTMKSLGSDGKLTTYDENSTSTTTKSGYVSETGSPRLETFLQYTKSVESYSSTTGMRTSTTYETTWNGSTTNEVMTLQSVSRIPTRRDGHKRPRTLMERPKPERTTAAGWRHKRIATGTRSISHTTCSGER
ncbi:MAG: hypothetical protein U0570_04055 [Phycisphaerales bacterium]